MLLAAVALSGCGGEDVERVRDRATEKARELRAEFRERRDRLRARIREVLGEIEQAIPEATFTLPEVQSRGRTEPGEIDAFMEDVLGNIDRYWTRTLTENGLPEPRVGFSTISPGGFARSGCGISAGDTAAFYCPRDDTIYIGEQFATDLYDGVARGLPGESAGYGRASGDFAVGYVLAHEYAHNLQQELGFFNASTGPEARPFELQADCLAGSWANSAYDEGVLRRDDLDEILDTALAVGDFEVGSAEHHGTPEERRSAVLVGFRSGDPSACDRYVPGL